MDNNVLQREPSLMAVRDTLLYPLNERHDGRQVFGGEPTHRGILPAGSIDVSQ